MKWWFKPVLIFTCIVEIAMGVYLGVLANKRKQAQVLGSTSVSIIDKKINTPNPKSSLKYYYEPGVSRKETDVTSWLKEKITWTYNNDTLNDRFDYEVVKPPNTYRIIAIGDSFTFGDHVNTADSWPERLEGELNAKKICANYDSYEVLNLGVRGFDIQYEVERYRLHGQKYNPDLVIWMVAQNDFEEINELLMPIFYEIYDKLNKDKMSDGQNKWKIAEDRAKREFWKKYDEKSRFAIEDKFVAQFNALFNGPLIFAPLPLSDTSNAHVQQWVQQRKHSYYFDSSPNAFDNDDLNFMRFRDGHPSVLGHELIAKRMYEFIQQKHIIPCEVSTP